MSSEFGVRSSGSNSKTCNQHSAIRNQKGMALLMTILIITLLSILIIDVHSRSRLAITRAKNSADSLKAYYIMRSGVSAAMGFLERDAKESGAVDTLSEEWAIGVKDFPVGDGTVTVSIVDEASKFNINTLVNAQGARMDKAVERFGRLLKGLEVDEGLSDKAAEWLKMNRKELSYTFRDISELLLLPDFTPDAFKKVKDYITVHSNQRININTVGREVLAALSPSLDEALIEGIMDYRKEHIFKNTDELSKVAGLSDLALRLTFSDILSVGSSYFSVTAEAKLSDTVRKGTAVINRAGNKVVVWKEE